MRFGGFAASPYNSRLPGPCGMRTLERTQR
jgi:hypothetical protein